MYKSSQEKTNPLLGQRKYSNCYYNSRVGQGPFPDKAQREATPRVLALVSL